MESRRPIKGPTEEFLFHGVPHAFPAALGGPTRGVPTAHAAQPLSSQRGENLDAELVHPGRALDELVNLVDKDDPLTMIVTERGDLRNPMGSTSQWRFRSSEC